MLISCYFISPFFFHFCNIPPFCLSCYFGICFLQEHQIGKWLTSRILICCICIMSFKVFKLKHSWVICSWADWRECVWGCWLWVPLPRYSSGGGDLWHATGKFLLHLQLLPVWHWWICILRWLKTFKERMLLCSAAAFNVSKNSEMRPPPSHPANCMFE